MYSFKQPASFF